MWHTFSAINAANAVNYNESVNGSRKVGSQEQWHISAHIDEKLCLIMAYNTPNALHIISLIGCVLCFCGLCARVCVGCVRDVCVCLSVYVYVENTERYTHLHKEHPFTRVQWQLHTATHIIDFQHLPGLAE